MMMNRARATGWGLLALVFWSTTIAVSRSLEEQVGAMRAGAAMYFGGAVLAFALSAARGEKGPALRALPRRYLLVCGGLFALYAVSLYLAIGFAVDRHQVQEVTVLNYLWPGLTLALSIPILRHRPRPLFAVGLLTAFAGVAVVVFRGEWQSMGAVWSRLCDRPGPYVGGLIAGVSWALFSNLTRKWAGGRPGQAAPWFFLVTAAVLAGLSVWRGETSHLSGRVLVELGYAIIFPTFLAYSLWEIGIRQGNLVVLGACSNGVPVLAAVLNGWYLGIPVPASVWVGCGLIMAGSWLSRRMLLDPAGPDS